MTRIVVATIPQEVDELLPPGRSDGSRIGVNYSDAFGKCLNVTLAEERIVHYKRRGVEVTLALGEQVARTMIDRATGNEDAEAINRQTLTRLAAQLGCRYVYEDRTVILEPLDVG